MFSVVLGAILRSKGRNYKEISIVAGVFALFLFLISLLLLSLTTLGLESLVNLVPEGVFINLVSPERILAGAILVGVGAFISMMFGALILDLAEEIIKGIR